MNCRKLFLLKKWRWGNYHNRVGRSYSGLGGNQGYSVFDLFWLIILVAVVSSILVFLEGQYGFENFFSLMIASSIAGFMLLGFLLRIMRHFFRGKSKKTHAE